MSGQIDLTDELTVDGFCGGGGWSTGFELAIGRPVDIGINHDGDAIAMHKKNHPFTKHYNENIFEVDPYEATQGRPVGWAHFSPDCTHFSRAKGGTPVKKSIRGLAWVVTKWAGTVHPRIISMENVPEFMTWGPLCAMRTPDGRIITNELETKTVNGKQYQDYRVAGKGQYVPYDKQLLIPDKHKRGQTFRRFISVMKSLGYEYEWRILTASDYGAPTIRKRLFIIFRNDGQPIVWPKPTHGDPNSEGFKYSNLLPWHTAAECIDWSIPCPSIFERKKPLADNTLKRIAKGIQKFVIENPKPFIVQVNHSGDNFRGQSVDKPLPTVTAKHGYGIVTPTLIQYHGEQSENEVRGQALERPLQTVDTRNRYGLVTAFMSKYFGGGYKGAGSGVDEPLHTVTAVDHNALAAVHITQFNNHCIGQKADEPLNTIATSGGHFGEVRAFLIKYFSTGTAKSVDEPLDTITTKDRFGLVTIEGQDYAIVDIGLRMLTPRELYNAQGFPPDYEIETDCYGKAYPRTKQVARCGNSVPPPFATALVRANASEWCHKNIRTMDELMKGMTA